MQLKFLPCADVSFINTTDLMINLVEVKVLTRWQKPLVCKLISPKHGNEYIDLNLTWLNI